MALHVDLKKFQGTVKEESVASFGEIEKGNRFLEAWETTRLIRSDRKRQTEVDD